MPENAPLVETLIRNGMAAIVFFDDEGTLHVGYIEKEPIEQAIASETDGESTWGQAIASLEGVSGDVEEGLLPQLREVAGFAKTMLLATEDTHD